MDSLSDDSLHPPDRDDQVRRLLEAARSAPTVADIRARPIGGSIQALRLMAGYLSTADLAEKSDLPEEFLVRVEEESAELNYDDMHRLARALGITTAHLVFIFELAEAAPATANPEHKPAKGSG